MFHYGQLDARGHYHSHLPSPHKIDPLGNSRRFAHSPLPSTNKGGASSKGGRALLQMSGHRAADLAKVHAAGSARREAHLTATLGHHPATMGSSTLRKTRHHRHRSTKQHHHRHDRHQQQVQHPQQPKGRRKQQRKQQSNPMASSQSLPQLAGQGNRKAGASKGQQHGDRRKQQRRRSKRRGSQARAVVGALMDIRRAKRGVRDELSSVSTFLDFAQRKHQLRQAGTTHLPQGSATFDALNMASPLRHRSNGHHSNHRGFVKPTVSTARHQAEYDDLATTLMGNEPKWQHAWQKQRRQLRGSPGRDHPTSSTSSQSNQPRQSKRSKGSSSSPSPSTAAAAAAAAAGATNSRRSARDLLEQGGAEEEEEDEEDDGEQTPVEAPDSDTQGHYAASSASESDGGHGTLTAAAAHDSTAAHASGSDSSAAAAAAAVSLRRAASSGGRRHYPRHMDDLGSIKRTSPRGRDLRRRNGSQGGGSGRRQRRSRGGGDTSPRMHERRETSPFRRSTSSPIISYASPSPVLQRAAPSIPHLHSLASMPSVVSHGSHRSIHSLYSSAPAAGAGDPATAAAATAAGGGVTPGSSNLRGHTVPASLANAMQSPAPFQPVATARTFRERARRAMLAEAQVGGAAARTVWSLIRRDCSPRTLQQCIDLSGGPDIVLTSRDPQGATPTLSAVALGRIKLAEYLLHAYPRTRLDVFGEESELAGANMLHLAVLVHNFQLVQLLVETEPQLLSGRVTGTFFAPSTPCYYGQTALSFAVCTNQRAVVHFLLDNSPPFALESVDVEGNNLLHLCVRNNQKKTYDIIADAWTAWMTSIGVQHRTPLWLAPNKEGLTCLTLAAKTGSKDMFSHVLERQRLVRWKYASVTCVLYPLDELDIVHGTGKGALEIMMQEERLELLGQRHVANLLDAKWEVFAQSAFKRKFFGTLALLILFMGVVTMQRQAQFAPNEAEDMWGSLMYWLRGSPTESRHFQVSRLWECDANESAWHCRVRLISELIVLCATLYKGAKEVRELSRESLREYISVSGAAFVENVSSLVFTACAVAVALLRAMHSPLEDGALAFACVAAWSHMLYFCLGYPLTGQYVVAIYKMLVTDVARFTILYGVFLMGFASSLYVLMDESGVGVFLTRIKNCFTAMLGDFQFDEYYENTRFPVLTVLVFVAYNMLVPVMLLNMLVALMENTLGLVSDEAEGRWKLERARIIMSIENEMTPEERHLESRQYWVVVDGRKYLPVEEVDHKFGRDGAMEDSSDSDEDGNEGSGGEGKQAGKKKKSKTRKSSSRRQRSSSVTNNSRLDSGEGEVYSDTDASAALMGSPGLSEGRGPRRRPQTTRARSHARSHTSSVDSYNAGSAHADAVAADSARH